MNKFRLFTQLFKDVKETPHHPELTNILTNSESFKKAALQVHDFKLKFWRELDKAAFPENYEGEKAIEDKSKPKNK